MTKFLLGVVLLAAVSKAENALIAAIQVSAQNNTCIVANEAHFGASYSKAVVCNGYIVGQNLSNKEAGQLQNIFYQSKVDMKIGTQSEIQTKLYKLSEKSANWTACSGQSDSNCPCLGSAIEWGSANYNNGLALNDSSTYIANTQATLMGISARGNYKYMVRIFESNRSNGHIQDMKTYYPVINPSCRVVSH